jgi:hypothetical protein
VVPFLTVTDTMTERYARQSLEKAELSRAIEAAKKIG